MDHRYHSSHDQGGLHSEGKGILHPGERGDLHLGGLGRPPGLPKGVGGLHGGGVGQTLGDVCGYGQQAGDTHPTGMLSYSFQILGIFPQRNAR